MTGFDNGPKDGDFVRYIEALNAARAAAPSPNGPSPAPGPSVFSAQHTPRPSSVPATAGSTRPVPAPPRSATQANAIASVLLRADGTVGPREWSSIAAFAVGVVLLLAGLVASTFNAVYFAAGAALVYATVGRWVRHARLGADSPLAALFASRRR